MIKVLAGGVFDLLHEGHEYFLNKAKEFGDYLIVVVTNDENVKKKDLRNNQETRAENLRKLGIADEVLIGYPGDEYMKIVEEVKPNAIVLGYDQELLVPEQEIKALGIMVKKISKLGEHSSTKLREE
jgi:FAD synthetase